MCVCDTDSKSLPLQKEVSFNNNNGNMFPFQCYKMTSQACSYHVQCSIVAFIYALVDMHLPLNCEEDQNLIERSTCYVKH